MAAKILARTGPITRFPSAAAFASYCGVAPIEVSSGEVVRHRLSRAGDRQLNYALHVMALAQIRYDGPGRSYYQRKRTAGKSHKEAMRCLKRRLADVVYRQPLADAMRPSRTGSGGHPGTTLQSSVADSHPDIDTSDQSLPGPAASLEPPSSLRLDTEGSHVRASGEVTGPVHARYRMTAKGSEPAS